MGIIIKEYVYLFTAVGAQIYIYIYRLIVIVANEE